jgi:2-methylcitrate dehydratase
MSLARQLAEYAHALRFSDLGETVVHEVKRRVLDSIGCALGAYDSDVARISRRVAAGAAAERGATVWCTPGRALPPIAAFTNGAMVRYLDCNDTYLSLEPAHPSDNIPAAFAAAEAAGADGPAVITSIALAYEVQCRFCDAASIRAHGWDHVTYGAFSSALAAGKLLGLTVDQLEQAVNIAGVQSAALRQTRAGQLSMWKGCAFANAARNGLFSAWLAAEGMTGPYEIFEGPMGFWKQVSGPFLLDVEQFGGRDRPFMILNTSIKFWPAEYHSQSAIDAALQLRVELGGPGEIEQLDVYTFDAAVDIIGGEPEKWRPTSRETADHSLPYCITAALVDGEITLAQFTDERIRDPQLLDLMAKIAIHRDPAATARYPEGIPNRLVITRAGGSTLEREVTYPRGHARNPMTDEEVHRKYAAWASRWMSPGQIAQLAGAVWRLDELPNLDPLMEALVLPQSNSNSKCNSTRSIPSSSSSSSSSSK